MSLTNSIIIIEEWTEVNDVPDRVVTDQPCQFAAAFGDAVVKTVANCFDDGNFIAVAKIFFFFSKNKSNTCFIHYCRKV